eukprot:2355968-Ditylum_brightwellii.AAC.1
MDMHLTPAGAQGRSPNPVVRPKTNSPASQSSSQSAPQRVTPTMVLERNHLARLVGPRPQAVVVKAHHARHRWPEDVGVQ